VLTNIYVYSNTNTDLVTQLRTATVAGDIDQVFALVKQGAWPNHQRYNTEMKNKANTYTNDLFEEKQCFMNDTCQGELLMTRVKTND